MTELGASIVARAIAYIGTPYHAQGRNEHGIDCAGLVFMAVSAAGGFVRDHRPYKTPTPWRVLLDALEPQTESVDLRDIRPGDVMLFGLVDNSRPRHMAICSGIDPLHMITVEIDQPTHERLVPVGWLDRLHSARRFRKA